MPIPPPMNSQWRRCSEVASRSRGNHASGTETTRPSAKPTLSVSSVHETPTAKASVLSPKVLMPSLHEQFSVLDHEASDLGKLITAKPRLSANSTGSSHHFA